MTTKEVAVITKKQVAPPPIIIKQIKNYPELIAKIKENVNENDFKMEAS